jgi:tetratricopeptide (TPR) repeat protein
MRGTHGAVGRESELSSLALALDRAGAGRGATVCVSGEAGSGKSHLAEAFAAAAATRGAVVLWGRCWEAGGAPPLWPWMQILRALQRDVPSDRLVSGPHASALRRILPELPAGEPAPELEPAQARFALLDAVATALADAGKRTPLAIVLDDLHAADPQSLEVLEFVAQQAPAMPVAVLATFRDPECRSGAPAESLGRLSRHTQVLRLHPLGPDAVAQLGAEIAGQPLAANEIADLTRITGGNPLYVIELLRRFGAGAALQRALADAAVALPEGVRSAIRERIARLPEATRRCLEIAAGCGRQFRDVLVAAAAEIDAEALADTLAPAVRAAVVAPVGAHEHAFSHILVREVLYRDLDPAERRDVHLRLADALERSVPGGAQPPMQELALHLERAGPSARERAVAAFMHVADDATRRGAFDEAATALEHAVALLPQGPGADPRHRCDLLLRLGDARLHAGAFAAGQVACEEAAALARAIRDPERLARAALHRGTIFSPGKTDPELAAALSEALDGLGPAPTPLRARLMARLAAARQPENPPEGPIALARRAIAAARESGDPSTLLEVLRSAISAMMDLGDPVERAALNAEHIELAERLRRPVEQLRGLSRRFFDLVEQGELAQAVAHLDRAEAIAISLRLAHHRWSIEALRASVAATRGDPASAWRHHDRAVELAREAGDAWGSFTLSCQRLGLWRVLLPSPDPPEDAFAEVSRVPPEAGRFAQLTARLMVSGVLARLGRADDPRVKVAELAELLEMGDGSSQQVAIELAAATGDTQLLLRAYPEACKLRARNVSFGLSNMHFEEPMTRALGMAAAALGRYDEAWPCFEEARTRAEAMGAVTHLAHIDLDHAQARLRRGDPDDLRVAPALLAAARATAEKTGMHGMLARIDAIDRGAPAPNPEPVAALPRAELTLHRDGETWVVGAGDRSIRLRDSKGMRLLARLVAERGRELHVLDLEHEGGAAGIDRGDAGEILDPDARAQYRERVRALRDEIEEAEQWADPARAERAQDELHAIEDELARAVGLGGRARRSGAAAERARVNVQRRLRDAMRRVAAQDDALGRHLEWAVRTGMYCSYDPR